MSDLLRNTKQEHFLSAAEATQFARDGYIIIQDAIPNSNDLDKLETHIDRLDSLARDKGNDDRGTTLDEHKNAIYLISYKRISRLSI